MRQRLYEASRSDPQTAATFMTEFLFLFLLSVIIGAARGPNKQKQRHNGPRPTSTFTTDFAATEESSSSISDFLGSSQEEIL